MDFDVVVVGSGFGGSVMSCRLVEKGMKVCLLERGKEYGMYDFPRRIHDVKKSIFWDPKDGKYGHMEFRDYPDHDIMSVTGSGLGGGSLIYANVLLPMPEDFFKGWPYGITRADLDPYYQQVLSMMEASPYPYKKDPYYTDTPKTRTMEEASAGVIDNPAADVKFVLPDLAVWFKGDFPGEQMKNKHGAIQSKCNKCGECDVGCNIKAKNTLDLNYIFKARHDEKNPLEVRCSAELVDLERLAEGFEVTYQNPETKEKTVVRAKKVILSCGSIGSSKVMINLKKKGRIPNVSPTLGRNWCGNGDLLGFARKTKKVAEPTNGPTITTGIQYQYKEGYKDGFPHGMIIEDAGLPLGLSWYLAAKTPSAHSLIEAMGLGLSFVKSWFTRVLGFKSAHAEYNIGDEIADCLENNEGLRHTVGLLGMGRDRSSGVIDTDEEGEPVVQWEIEESQLHFDRVTEEMKKISKAAGGDFMGNPLTKLNKIAAVHPLGGCIMAETAEQGVVDRNGEVFGEQGLYVIDGSILPSSVGPNPSLTIAAMAESLAERFEL